MYFYKDKKYVEIMPVIKDKVIVSYKVLKTDKETLGWETLNNYIIYEKDGKRYVDESMIKLIKCLVYEGYEILGKKEKNMYF